MTEETHARVASKCVVNNNECQKLLNIKGVALLLWKLNNWFKVCRQNTEVSLLMR